MRIRVVLIDTRANVIHLDDWLKGLETTKLQPFEPTEVAIRVYGKYVNAHASPIGVKREKK